VTAVRWVLGPAFLCFALATVALVGASTSTFDLRAEVEGAKLVIPAGAEHGIQRFQLPADVVCVSPGATGVRAQHSACNGEMELYGADVLALLALTTETEWRIQRMGSGDVVLLIKATNPNAAVLGEIRTADPLSVRRLDGPSLLLLVFRKASLPETGLALGVGARAFILGNERRFLVEDERLIGRLPLRSGEARMIARSFVGDQLVQGRTFSLGLGDIVSYCVEPGADNCGNALGLVMLSRDAPIGIAMRASATSVRVKREGTEGYHVSLSAFERLSAEPLLAYAWLIMGGLYFLSEFFQKLLAITARKTGERP
jgi:hypothetical protein